MRRIAVINQKGGVGKTTTCANLGAALARLGRKVVLVDMDAQANLSMHLGAEVGDEQPSSYSVLMGRQPLAAAIRDTKTADLFLVPSHLELSGAELELASTFGRETLLRIAVEDWEREVRQRTGAAPADYLIFDCPPSLGLLSINALAAAGEVLIALQTEFFALQGMSTLVDVVQLLKRRIHPALEITGILPCLYDSRKKLAREVLAEIRTYFPGKVMRTPVRANVKLAEAPSFGQTIFEYAPDSNGALDYLRVAEEVLEAEARDAELSVKPRTPCVAPPCDAPMEAAAVTPTSGDAVPCAAGESPSLVEADACPAHETAIAAEPPSATDTEAAAGAVSSVADPEPVVVGAEPIVERAPVEHEAVIERSPGDGDAELAPVETANEAVDRELPATTLPPVARPADAERTYVLHPVPPPRPVPAIAGPARTATVEHGAPGRPNDLLSMCLRSLRSLWH